MTARHETLTHDATVLLGDGLRVSRLGFGGMSLTDVYGPVSDEQALATLAHAVDRGVTFVDTANIYGRGRSETVVGRLLRTRRDEVQVATKFGIVPGGGIGARGLRSDREYLRGELEGSLQRLGTDRVDLYYQHRQDPEVPIEDVVGALAELVHEGKVLHIGLSEVTADELRRAHAVHPIAAVQSEWSITSRDVEAEVLPTAQQLGVGFVAYSSLGRKWLTGVFDIAELEEGDARWKFPRFAPDALEANRPILDEVLSVAAEAEATAAQVALAWLAEKGRAIGLPVVSIPGTRVPQRVDENLAAFDVRLTSAQVQRLDTLAGRVVGHRSFRPEWVSQGRE